MMRDTIWAWVSFVRDAEHVYVEWHFDFQPFGPSILYVAVLETVQLYVYGFFSFVEIIRTRLVNRRDNSNCSNRRALPNRNSLRIIYICVMFLGKSRMHKSRFLYEFRRFVLRTYVYRNTLTSPSFPPFFRRTANTRTHDWPTLSVCILHIIVVWSSEK